MVISFDLQKTTGKVKWDGGAPRENEAGQGWSVWTTEHSTMASRPLILRGAGSTTETCLNIVRSFGVASNTKGTLD